MTAKTRPHESWDRLCASETFRAYLGDRGMVLSETPPPPPHDLEAEQAALGAMLMGDDQAVEVGVRRLRPPMFYNASVHRPVLIAIGQVNRHRLQGRDIHVDVISVCSQLRRTKDLETEGGTVPAAYLTALIDACPSSRNINAYIEPIIETARLRSMLHLSCWLQEVALSPDAVPEQLCNALHNAAAIIERHGVLDTGILLAGEK